MASQRRHRFQKVDERVDNLRQDLQLHAKTNASEDWLTFQEELQLQAELTMLDGFQRLYRKLLRLVNTTPQLLHHLPKVVKLLQDELEAEGDEELQRERLTPILKLLTALARELRSAFYPYFAQVLPGLVSIIDTKDPELSTRVFKTVTMMFSYLRMHILQDMDAVHKCYFPLLGHTKEFVREFAAQTLSTLLRRIETTKGMKKYLINYLQALTRGAAKDNEALQDGSAKLFFNLLRNVKHGFHSRMQETFTALLSTFRKGKLTEDQEGLDAMYEILRRTSEALTHHTDAQHAGELLNCYLAALDKVLASSDRDNEYFSRLVFLLRRFAGFRGGKLLSEQKDSVAALHQRARTLLEDAGVALASDNENLREEVLQFFDSVWRLFPDKDSIVKSQVQTFFAMTENKELKAWYATRLLLWTQRVLKHEHIQVDFIEQNVYPNALPLAFNTLLEDDVTGFAMLVCDLGEYAREHRDELSASSFMLSDKLYRFFNVPAKSQHEILTSNVTKCIQRCLKADDDERKQHLAAAWKYLQALSLVNCAPNDLAKSCHSTLPKIDKAISTASKEDADEWHVVRAQLWRLEYLCEKDLPKKKSKQSEPEKRLLPMLHEHSQSYTMLCTIRDMLQLETPEKQQQLFPSSSLDKSIDKLRMNLQSPSHELRLVSLEILTAHEQHEYVEEEDGARNGKCDMFDLCTRLESMCEKLTVRMERDVTHLIDRVKSIARSTQTPTVYKIAAGNHLLGLYHVKFATLWPHVADAVEAVARVQFTETWGSIEHELVRASFRQEDSNVTFTVDAEASDKEVETQITTQYNEASRLEKREVKASEVTDHITHHSLLWKGLLKVVDLVESKTKFIVPLFFVFLSKQYAYIYKDELSDTMLQQLHDAVQHVASADQTWHEQQVSETALSTKTVRSKFIDQLKVFAAFKNMKGAYAQTLLHSIFFDLLLKSDEAISQLALQCLMTFNNKHLTLYKENLMRLASLKTFREELTTFDVRADAGVVQNEHRSTLLPVMLRLLYSKCVSKKGRKTGDTVPARRATIMAYLASLDPSELEGFVALLARPFDLEEESLRAPDGCDATLVSVENVQSSRILGFLNLLEDVVNQLKGKLSPFVPAITNLLLSILQHNKEYRTEEEDVDMEIDNDKDQEETSSNYTAAMKRQTRMLTYRRLREVFEVYDALAPLTPQAQMLVSISKESILQLPNAVIGAEKASSLMDVLVAIASSNDVHHVLSSDMVESVLACLSAGLSTTTSEGTISRGIRPAVLEKVVIFINALLDQDEHSEASEKQMVPQIPCVLQHFVTRFESKTARHEKEHSSGSSKRELSVLCRLSEHLTASPDSNSRRAAKDLFQLLLPFLLRNHHSSPQEKQDILDVLTRLVPLVDDPRKHLFALSKLLAPGPNCIDERFAREKVVNVFVSISQHPSMPELAPVADFLQSLNAYDTARLEEVDIERRMDALQHTNEAKFVAFRDDATLLAPVLSQYLQLMHDNEFAVRSAALFGVTAFLDLAASAASAKDTKSPLLSVLESVVMPAVRISLKSRVEQVRRGFVSLLGEIADREALHNLPSVPGDLKRLRTKHDLDTDFFANVVHIQAHRRRRAIQRLSALMEEMAKEVKEEEEKETSTHEVFSNSTLNSIVIPLVLHFVFEEQSKGQEAIRNEAAACVGSAAGLMTWSSYLSLLRRLLKWIDGHGENEATIIDAVCSVVDHFHFPTPGTAEGWSTETSTDITVENSKIQDSMETQVLPLLQNYLFKAIDSKGKSKASKGALRDEHEGSNKTTVVRTPIGLAVVKILRRLRAETFYAEFPKLLMNVVRLLKSKEEAVRVSARSTLVKIVVELGPRYLYPVVEELRSTLRDGYMVHVLAFTLHSILDKVVGIVDTKKPPSLLEDASTKDTKEFASPLDPCISSIMPIIVEELFRNIVENQDGSIAPKSKMKEAKGTQGYDSLELLARSITFLPNPSIHEIIAALVEKFKENENAKSIEVLQESLKHVALGLTKNAGAERTYICLYVHNMLSKCLETISPASDKDKQAYEKKSKKLSNTWLVNEKSDAVAAELAKPVSAKAAVKVELQPRMTGNHRETERQKQQQTANSTAHIDQLLHFGIYMFYSVLRVGTLDPSIADPFVQYLMRCTKEAKANRTIVLALKCLTMLVPRNDLPSMNVAMQPLVNHLFKMLQKSGAATRNEVVQACYKTLTQILKQRPDYPLKESQLRVLLSFVRADLDQRDHQNATYSMLRAVVASRLVIPEVYDVITRIGELLVRSETLSGRSNCGAIYVSFLLDYPLGPKRLTQHLKFLVDNLNYTYETGRKSVLEALVSLVNKFPEEILNERAQFFFLPLVLRLTNDESAECRQLSGDVIEALLRRLGKQQVNESMSLVMTWWKSGASDPQLLMAAAQVTQIFVKARPDVMDRNATTILDTIQQVLATNIKEAQKAQDAAQVQWQVASHLLTCLLTCEEKLVRMTETWMANNAKFVWENVFFPLTRYPHSNVRTMALKLINVYLHRRSSDTLRVNEDSKLPKEVKSDAFLKTPGTLFKIASTMCKLLSKPGVSEDAANETLSIILFTCSALTSFPSIPQNVTDEEIAGEESDEGELGDDEDSKAIQERSKKEQSAAKESAKTPLGWVLTRLSFIARHDSPIAQRTIFKLFAALIQQQDVDFAKLYMMQLLNPLYRVAQQKEEEESENSVASFAQEVMEHLERKVGAEAFADSYTFVQKRLALFRAQRRDKRKRELVNDPEAAARRKMQKNDQKRRSKQLKKRKFALMKGSASAVTKPKKMPRPGAE